MLGDAHSRTAGRFLNTYGIINSDSQRSMFRVYRCSVSSSFLVVGMKTLRFLFSAMLIAWPTTSLCAVIESDWRMPGDGLLTHDLESRMEWLDLTESQLTNPSGHIQEALDALIVEMEPGGRLEGFEFASQDELQAFAESAGIDTSTRNHTVNGMPASNLIALLGNPQGTSIGNGSATGRLVRSGHLAGAMSVASFPGGRSHPDAGLVSPDSLEYATRNHGVWLWRPAKVPEPSTVGMLLFAGWICLIRSRHTNKSFNDC